MLETARTNLIPITPDDFALSMQWLNNPELTRWMQKPYFQTYKSMYKYFEAMQEPHLWLAIKTKSGVHIGNISLKDNSADKYYSEISIIIGDTKYHGKGYASEAIKALTDYCFRVRGIHCIQAGAVSLNAACIRAFTHVGYEIETTLAQRVYCDGNWQNLVILSKFKEDKKC